MKKRKFSKAEAHELYTRMDVGCDIAKAMNRRDVKLPLIASLTGTTVRKFRSILGGDTNLTLNEVANILRAMRCRFDLVVTPIDSDEWVTKRTIEKLENKVWAKPKDKKENRSKVSKRKTIDMTAESPRLRPWLKRKKSLYGPA